MSDSEYELRTVHLPLKSLDKCAQCGKTTSLHLCSSCGERIYCSSECQTKDWPSHKKKCGKTDRIDLGTFYPFLACLAETAHVHENKPIHPAITHAIVNSPNPGSAPTKFPDGSQARLILLGEEIPLSHVASSAWWPSATSDKVRSKLFRRLGREGLVLPIVTSICVALLAEMYTTDAISASNSPDGNLKQRVRLRYRSSPISDFGIAKGSVDVKDQDKLAYLDLVNKTFTQGQDPGDHYWIYFTTIRGEEVILDCAMFTFNMCLIVPADPYRGRSLPPFSYAPALFRDRAMNRTTPDLQTESKRASVLRNTDLHRAVEHSRDNFRSIDTKSICEFMENLAGRECTPLEKDLVMVYTLVNCQALTPVLENQTWKKFPTSVVAAVEADPGEMDDCTDDGDDAAWLKYMKKWNKMHKKGQISKETLGDAFRAWNNRKRAG